MTRIPRTRRRTALAVLFGLAAAGCGTPSGTVARLAHPDPAERLAAVVDLDRRPERAARPALLRAALADPDPRVRQNAALVLESQTGESLEGLAVSALRGKPDLDLSRWLLTSSREALRAAAVPSLRQLGTPEAWSLLAEHLPEDASPGVRLLCAQALAEGADRGAGPAHRTVLRSLRRGLGDEEPAVRLLCARALGREGDEAAVPELARALAGAPPADRPGLITLLRTATGEDLGEEPEAWIRRYAPAGGRPDPRNPG